MVHDHANGILCLEITNTVTASPALKVAVLLSPPQLSSGGVTPWTSPQFIVGQHRNDEQTFAPTDSFKFTFPNLPHVNVFGRREEAVAPREPHRHSEKMHDTKSSLE